MTFLIVVAVWAVGYLLAFFRLKTFVKEWNGGSYGKRELRDTLFLSIFSWLVIAVILYFMITLYFDDWSDEKGMNKKYDIRDEGPFYMRPGPDYYEEDKDFKIDRKQ